MILKLYEVQDNQDSVEEEEESEVEIPQSVVAGNELSYQERLEMHLQKSKELLPDSSDESAQICQNLIDQEFNLFEQSAGKERSKYVNRLFKSLSGIPPTSVESERSFSATGLFCTKIRSSLGDKTLDALLFLRQYFLREEKLKKK